MFIFRFYGSGRNQVSLYSVIQVTDKGIIKEMLEFLSNFKVYSSEYTANNTVNISNCNINESTNSKKALGTGCLVAQFITKFKGKSNIYLCPIDIADYEEYPNFYVMIDEEKTNHAISIDYKYNNNIYTGYPDDVLRVVSHQF